ncbi:MAG: tetratricopeptide repeat protein [Candidatus Eisenbacteria sp.]|nr:tetratricopeptide repeat protein [Candidatus Eisenbacteria bacterium]
MGLFDNLFGGSLEKLEARGDRLMEEKDFTGAAQAYRNAFRKCENKDPEAASRIRTKLDLADDQAVKEFAKLVREHLEDGEPEIAGEQLEVARNFAREHPGEYDELFRELEAAIRARVKSDIVETQRGYDKQMQDSLREKEMTPELIEFEQTLNVLASGDVEEARTYGPHFQKGFMALAQGDFITAVEELQLATHERPESALTYEQWGKALEMGGQSAQARTAYRKAIQRDPRRREARLSLATILDTLENKSKEALELLAEGIEEVPTDEAPIRMAMGGIHLHRRRPTEAVSELERALELLGDGIPDLWHMLGSAYEMAGSLDLAEGAFQAAYGTDSRNPARRVQYVEFCLRNKRNLDGAESALTSICQSCGFPGDPHTMATLAYYMAVIAATRGKHEEALSSIARALSQGVPSEFEERFRQLEGQLRKAVD